MKKLICMSTLAWFCTACGGGGQDAVTVTVENPLHVPRESELVEVSMEQVSDLLYLADTAQIVVLDAEGEQVPYQVTYNDLLVFPVKVDASGKATYTVRPGAPKPVEVIACGRPYPERDDDMAWENDLGGYRAYGPALQARGERGFGYDLFTKYNTTAPVLEEMYAKELNAESRAEIDELRQKGEDKAADELAAAISYHIDHGYGMDCYAVGSTLGAGTAALLADSAIAYPWCYSEQEVLDNGPLRFTVRLVFHPLRVKGDTAVVETRLISLDAGSRLNKTTVSYANLSAGTPLVTGIVLHESEGAAVTLCNAEAGYMTYVDPTTGPGQGRIFTGAAFPAKVDSIRPVFFPPEEKEVRGNADGHILAYDTYTPGTEYVYYWGFAWDKAAIQTPEAWNEYMDGFAQRIRHPLAVAVE